MYMYVRGVACSTTVSLVKLKCLVLLVVHPCLLKNLSVFFIPLCSKRIVVAGTTMKASVATDVCTCVCVCVCE